MPHTPLARPYRNLGGCRIPPNKSTHSAVSRYVDGSRSCDGGARNGRRRRRCAGRATSPIRWQACGAGRLRNVRSSRRHRACRTGVGSPGAISDTVGWQPASQIGARAGGTSAAQAYRSETDAGQEDERIAMPPAAQAAAVCPGDSPGVGYSTHVAAISCPGTGAKLGAGDSNVVYRRRMCRY